MIDQVVGATGQVHSILDTIGSIIAVPALGTLIVLVRFIDQIKHTAEDTKNALLEYMGRAEVSHKEYVARADQLHGDHEERLRTAEERLGILWDGRERRKP